MGLTGGLASNGTSGSGGGGGGGTVTSVSAGSSKITVATGTTTPVIDIGAGVPIVRKFPFAYNTAGVSSDPAGHATVTAGSPPSTPLVVVTGVNDTFVFTPAKTGTPETFTVAAGTYSTVAACVAAMGAAVGGSAEAFSTKATPSNSAGSILLTEPTGRNGNGDTITVGATDVSAGLGFASPSTFGGVTITGAALYTPTIGDILLDGWIEVDTVWDGTTPLCDFGVMFDTDGDGWWAAVWGVPLPLKLGHPDDDTGAGGLLPPLSAIVAANFVTEHTQIQVSGTNLVGPISPSAAPRAVPIKFSAATPIKVCVSQDGTNTGADPGATQGAAILYLSTVTPL